MKGFRFFHKNCQLLVLLGSLVYMTSRWILITGFDHPFFAEPCYLLLIFPGVDKVLAGKSLWPISFSWAWQKWRIFTFLQVRDLYNDIWNLSLFWQ